MTTKVIVKCVDCNRTREVGLGDVAPDDVPMCDRCGAPMVPTSAASEQLACSLADMAVTLLKFSRSARLHGEAAVSDLLVKQSQELTAAAALMLKDETIPSQ